jgi:hypothetical protein
MSRRSTDGGVFLTWNDSRRSSSLSERLGARRVVMAPQRPGSWRHVAGSAETLAYLLRVRPQRITYQFSLMLGVLLAAYRELTLRQGVFLIADVHSKALRREGVSAIRPLVALAKSWALLRCDAVVVSNHQDASFAQRRLGVKAIVLPDPLPSVPLAPGEEVATRSADIVFVCSFAEDEPLMLIRDVASRLALDARVAITGDPRRLPLRLRAQLEEVAELTGFLAEPAYWQLLRSAGVVAVLSTEPACLPCGAYEVMALGRRPLLAAGAVVEGTFGAGAIYTSLEVEALERALCNQLRSASSSVGGDPAACYREAWELRWSEARPLLAPDSARVRGE